MPISPASTGLIRPLVLAQDLDTLAGPLPGELVKHQLTSGFCSAATGSLYGVTPGLPGDADVPAGLVTAGASPCAALEDADRFPRAD